MSKADSIPYWMRKNGGKIKIVGKQNNKNYRDCDKDINIEKNYRFYFMLLFLFPITLQPATLQPNDAIQKTGGLKNLESITCFKVLFRL